MISVQTVIILDYSFWPITICIFNHYRLSTASEIRCIYMAWIFRRPFFSAAKCLEIGCTILPLNGPKIKKIIFLKVVPHFSAIIFLIFGPFRAKMVHPISRHLQSRKRAYGKFKPYIYIYIYIWSLYEVIEDILPFAQTPFCIQNERQDILPNNLLDQKLNILLFSKTNKWNTNLKHVRV